mgnify:CR=1
EELLVSVTELDHIDRAVTVSIYLVKDLSYVIKFLRRLKKYDHRKYHSSKRIECCVPVFERVLTIS